MRSLTYALIVGLLSVTEIISAADLKVTQDYAVLVNQKGDTQLIEYKDVDGLAVVEGDIVLGSVDQIKSAHKAFKESGDTKQGLLLSAPRSHWSELVIPFTIDASIRDREADIRAAIAVWNNLLRPRLGHDVWIDRSNQGDFVTFTNATTGACLSPIGRQGGQQLIRLPIGCDVGRIEHEMGHTMGLFHEQSRRDRDHYITINYSNIRKEDRQEFDQHIADADAFGPYDYGSIMHYGAYDFAIDPTIPTIEAPEPIGQRNAPSTWDWWTAWRSFLRAGWNVRICDGTQARAIKFWVGSVRDGTLRSRYWFRWTAGSTTELPFPSDLMLDQTVWIKGEGDPHAQINMCIVHNQDPKQGMTFDADESKEVNRNDHTNGCRCH